jgi:hypothetical protein
VIWSARKGKLAWHHAYTQSKIGFAFNYGEWEEYGDEESGLGKFNRLILIDDEVHVYTVVKERNGDTIGEFIFETIPFDDFMEQDREEEDGISEYPSFSRLVEDFELLYAHDHKSYTYRMIKEVITEFEVAT